MILDNTKKATKMELNHWESLQNWKRPRNKWRHMTDAQDQTDKWMKEKKGVSLPKGGKNALGFLHSIDSLENQESVRFNIFTAAQLSIQSSKKHPCVNGWVVPDVPRKYDVFIFKGQAVNKKGARPLEMKTPYSLKVSENIHPTTKHCIWANMESSVNIWSLMQE
jgi:hypothetical protein